MVKILSVPGFKKSSEF